MLIKAGADPNSATVQGATPLYLAAQGGQWEVVKTLIKAGANSDSRPSVNGETSLARAAASTAAGTGRILVVRELLRAKADPLLPTLSSRGIHHFPLDAAASSGNVDVVRELLREFGIEGCGGPSGGLQALVMAAKNQHGVEILVALTEAGVVDTDKSLVSAAESGHEAQVKYLLQLEKQRECNGQAVYSEVTSPSALISAVYCVRSSSPRIARMLIDAGVDTTWPVQFTTIGGRSTISTPLALAESGLKTGKVLDEAATQEQLDSLEAIRRLLLRVEAARATSWLWLSNARRITHATAPSTETRTPSKRVMLPMTWRRHGNRGVHLPALFRYSTKP